MAHGGQIPPDNRGPQAKGVGKDSKRHDLERRKVPFFHQSDLQQGQVQALEQGQRIAPVQVQQPARGGAAPSRSANSSSQGVNIPDPIEFIAGRAGGGASPLAAPIAGADNVRAWMEFARPLITGPGSSGLLAGAYINQLRSMLKSPKLASGHVIDFNDIDDALEAMVEAG